MNNSIKTLNSYRRLPSGRTRHLMFHLWPYLKFPWWSYPITVGRKLYLHLGVEYVFGPPFFLSLHGINPSGSCCSPPGQSLYQNVTGVRVQFLRLKTLQRSEGDGIGEFYCFFTAPRKCVLYTYSCYYGVRYFYLERTQNCFPRFGKKFFVQG